MKKKEQGASVVVVDYKCTLSLFLSYWVRAPYPLRLTSSHVVASNIHVLQVICDRKFSYFCKEIVESISLACPLPHTPRIYSSTFQPIHLLSSFLFFSTNEEKQSAVVPIPFRSFSW